MIVEIHKTSKGKEHPTLVLYWSDKNISKNQKNEMIENIDKWLKGKLKKEEVVLINR